MKKIKRFLVFIRWSIGFCFKDRSQNRIEMFLFKEMYETVSGKYKVRELCTQQER